MCVHRYIYKNLYTYYDLAVILLSHKRTQIVYRIILSVYVYKYIFFFIDIFLKPGKYGRFVGFLL